MASIFRKTYSKTDKTTGQKVKTKSKKWWVKYRDADGVIRRVPGFADKSATQQYAAKLEREAELTKVGVPAQAGPVIGPAQRHQPNCERLYTPRAPGAERSLEKAAAGAWRKQ